MVLMKKIYKSHCGNCCHDTHNLRQQLSLCYIFWFNYQFMEFFFN